MVCNDGWIRKGSRLGSRMARAAALFALVSVSPPPSWSEDGGRTVAGESHPLPGSRIRLRPGVSPEQAGEGGGAETSAVRGSDEGLVEEAGMTAAGGTTVHLQGRYRSRTVLERDENGATTTDCISNLPARGRSD